MSAGVRTRVLRRRLAAAALCATCGEPAAAQARRASPGPQPREHPSAAERRRYFDAYNASRTPAGWDSLRRATSAAPPRTPGALRVPADARPVVSFRLRNLRPWPTGVEVAGNVFDVAPFETRYVQFPPGTRVHAYDAHRPGGRGRLLFAVTAADEGRALGTRR